MSDNPDESSISAASASARKETFRLDPVTAKDLEVFVSDNSVSRPRAAAGKSNGTTGITALPCLFNEMNSCRTSFGSRLLREWLSNPLVNVTAISERQKAVKWLVAAQHEAGLGKKAPVTPRAAWLASTNKILSGSGGNIEQLQSALRQGKLSPTRLVVLLLWAANLEGFLCTAEAAQDMALPPKLADIVLSKHLGEVINVKITPWTNVRIYSNASQEYPSE